MVLWGSDLVIGGTEEGGWILYQVPEEHIKAIAIVEWDGNVGLLTQDASSLLSKYLKYTNSQTVVAGTERLLKTLTRRILTQKDIF